MKNAVMVLWVLAGALLVVGIIAQLVLSQLDHEGMSLSARLMFVDAGAWADRLLLWCGVSALLAIATGGVQRAIREAARRP